MATLAQSGGCGGCMMLVVAVLVLATIESFKEPIADQVNVGRGNPVGGLLLLAVLGWILYLYFCHDGGPSK